MGGEAWRFTMSTRVDRVLVINQTDPSANGVFTIENTADMDQSAKCRLRRVSALNDAADLCREIGWKHYAERLEVHNEIDRIWGIARVEFDYYYHGLNGHRGPGRRKNRRLLARLLGALRRAEAEQGVTPALDKTPHVTSP
jgi:hypothetical protein